MGKRGGYSKVFRKKITRQYSSLSPSFTKIADFILTSHQRAAFMSASRLAKHVGVDVATVTRFAQQLGYEGYIELSREIQDKVLEEMHESRAPIVERMASAEGVFAQTLWRDWANLEKTIQHLSTDDAERAIDALVKARQIYFVAEGVGSGLAQAARSYLKMVRSQVFILEQGPFDTALELKDLGPEDVVVGIGFTNYAYAATRAVEMANLAGATTIGLIAQPNCSIGAHAQILFSCSVTEMGYLPSLTCMGAILFALVYSVCVKDLDVYNRNLVDFQRAYTDLTEGTPRDDDEVVEDLLALF
jgi:DNA-binding MurR/RpiR family transcriptional regulator